MSDSRQSSIPEEGTSDNVDYLREANDSTHEERQPKRRLKDQDVHERPGTNPKEQPGIPTEPMGPADGGD